MVGCVSFKTKKLSEYHFLKEHSQITGLQGKGEGLNLRKKKWLIFCIYNPHNRYIKHHLKELGKAIEFYSKTYENI